MQKARLQNCLKKSFLFSSIVKGYFAFKCIKANMIDEMMGTRFVEIICYLLNQLPGKYKL